jgi:ParB-like chromosome segregation protein Spo0J
MPELQVLYFPLEILSKNGRNARTHSRKQIRQIAASIDEFGFTNPLLIDKQNMVLAGHGRLPAARLLGMKRVPCMDGDVWSCGKGSTKEGATNKGSEVAVMRVIYLKA